MQGRKYDKVSTQSGLVMLFISFSQEKKCFYLSQKGTLPYFLSHNMLAFVRL